MFITDEIFVALKHITAVYPVDFAEYETTTCKFEFRVFMNDGPEPHTFRFPNEEQAEEAHDRIIEALEKLEQQEVAS